MNLLRILPAALIASALHAFDSEDLAKKLPDAFPGYPIRKLTLIDSDKPGNPITFYGDVDYKKKGNGMHQPGHIINIHPKMGPGHIPMAKFLAGLKPDQRPVDLTIRHLLGWDTTGTDTESYFKKTVLPTYYIDGFFTDTGIECGEKVKNDPELYKKFLKSIEPEKKDLILEYAISENSRVIRNRDNVFSVCINAIMLETVGTELEKTQIAHIFTTRVVGARTKDQAMFITERTTCIKKGETWQIAEFELPGQNQGKTFQYETAHKAHRMLVDMANSRPSKLSIK